MTNFSITEDMLATQKNIIIQTKTKKRLADFFIQNGISIDYKNADILRRFISQEGRILPGRRSGLTSKNQRKASKAIKKARLIGLLPFINLD